MDRALNLETLTAAVGEHARLPDPDQLRQLLADTEVSLFTQQAEIDERVLDTGWYLQAVATARPELNLYDLPRQRLAHQVSGHIFDLALQSTEQLTPAERLRLTFAAQVGYLGGDLTPNAAALAKRAPLPREPFEWSAAGQVSLEAGVLVLALDRPSLHPLLEIRRGQLDQFSSNLGDLATTPYAAVDEVIRGASALTTYLTRGNRSHLERAQQSFANAMRSEAAESDVDSRWVAAHLRRISDELGTTSVWAALPPDLPSAARAMTLGDPPVLRLWPPQLNFLTGDDGGASPLDPDVRRLVLSFPTSAGKTLLAQILITAHLASPAEGDVCVVAPTHSLCRELSHSLDRRLRTLGEHLYVEGPLGYDRPRPAAARVTVMTPEKLAALLRANPAGLLAKYSMFVVDEAHLVADPSRGWKLEESLTLLHHLTIDSAHRILLVSAALGNQSHIVEWMTGAGRDPLIHHTEWRGPRRLSAVYTTSPNWDNAFDEPAQGQRLARRRIPLHGDVHLLTGSTIFHGRFAESVGTLVRRQTRDGDWTRDIATSTERAQLVPLINHVSTSGPVLVIQPTRADAQRLAETVAETIDDGAENSALVDLAQTRLTNKHPLIGMLRKGVAFHHAALPFDIQAEIEESVRAGRIRILVATSTLIEGVNLPFKTVIVGRRGYPDSKVGYVETISATGLLNAVGRAGRAGRETEGWLILAELSADYSQSMFEPLQHTGDDLDIRSILATDEALAGLAAYEEASRVTEDAIFRHYEPSADGFLSFIWFTAQTLLDLHQTEASIDDILAVVQRTLAWRQLETDQQSRLVRSAGAALEAFDRQPMQQRARWARSGASLPTARTLDAIAENLLNRFLIAGEFQREDFVTVLDFVVDDDTLDAMLALPENPHRGFKPYRTAPRDARMPVDVKALLLDWVRGVEVQTLADNYLAAIEDEVYRSESITEFTASVFEHHLPWTLGFVLQSVNDQLAASGNDHQLPTQLPAVIHYGVDSEIALNLMMDGIRSRRLANSVATAAGPALVDESRTSRDWLASQTVGEWRERFSASPTEIADLLTFARPPDAQKVNSILEGSAQEFPIQATGEAVITATTKAAIRPEPHAADPAPMQVTTTEGVVGTIRLSDHDDVSLLIRMGIPLDIRVRPGIDDPIVSISLTADPDS